MKEGHIRLDRTVLDLIYPNEKIQGGHCWYTMDQGLNNYVKLEFQLKFKEQLFKEFNLNLRLVVSPSDLSLWLFSLLDKLTVTNNLPAD